MSGHEPSPSPKILLAKPGLVTGTPSAGKFGRASTADEDSTHLRSRLPSVASLNLLSDSWDFHFDRFLPVSNTLPSLLLSIFSAQQKKIVTAIGFSKRCSFWLRILISLWLELLDLPVLASLLLWINFMVLIQVLLVIIVFISYVALTCVITIFIYLFSIYFWCPCFIVNFFSFFTLYFKTLIFDWYLSYDSTGMLPPFTIQSEETRAMARHCSIGIEPRISSERIILLDTQVLTLNSLTSLLKSIISVYL